MKYCYMCRETLPLDQFGKDKSKADGKLSHCRNCHKQYDKLYRERIKANNPSFFADKIKYYRNKNPYWLWATNTISGHRRSGYNVAIKAKCLADIAKDITHCPICNVKLLWGNKISLKSNSPTLDRKDNGSILNLENTWIICNQCNQSKTNRNFDEFITYCEKVYHKFGDYTIKDSCILSQDFTVL